MKKNIYDYTLQALQKELEAIHQPAFRAKQLYQWLYTRYQDSFSDMANLPKSLRETLQNTYTIKNLEIIRMETSKDGSKKYLFKTNDGLSFESVLIKMRDKKCDTNGQIIESEKWTCCLSSQIGCKVGCAFCYTAKGGFVRNLSSGEIVEQVVQIKKDNAIAPEKRINIVYMGMGEPLNNMQNVIQAIKTLAELDGLSISPRRQTISTSGIAPKIIELGKHNLGVQLAISLHAVDNELRSKLIPMNKAYNIQSVIKAVRSFPVDERKKIMFEYLVIKDTNDDLASAKKLLKLLDGIRAKVNLILFNPHEGSAFERPDIAQVKKFADFLIRKGLLCTIRESKGIDISAACGQLREKELEKTS
ncbi:23S rRNA (adenine(2503)-C(2))-methyltransferase RlmN [Helicobacter sp. 11S02596-1]|uniref:23S rRNA (adenine(2503)-C(2))-methyltransferase RlmN n=1 Tax=Helicobacter sp. 11S02596-1 TaxID=1476194 RepID=UPI0021516030|nr:23S rRNA (adenine(2503)-C(2))-methyltransferase RlmN [Helicobacter sp. 11S02596-1]